MGDRGQIRDGRTPRDRAVGRCAQIRDGQTPRDRDAARRGANQDGRIPCDRVVGGYAPIRDGRSPPDRRVLTGDGETELGGRIYRRPGEKEARLQIAAP